MHIDEATSASLITSVTLQICVLKILYSGPRFISFTVVESTGRGLALRPRPNPRERIIVVASLLVARGFVASALPSIIVSRLSAIREQVESLK